MFFKSFKNTLAIITTQLKDCVWSIPSTFSKTREKNPGETLHSHYYQLVYSWLVYLQDMISQKSDAWSFHFCQLVCYIMTVKMLVIESQFIYNSVIHFGNLQIHMAQQMSNFLYQSLPFLSISFTEYTDHSKNSF